MAVFPRVYFFTDNTCLETKNFYAARGLNPLLSLHWITAKVYRVKRYNDTDVL